MKEQRGKYIKWDESSDCLYFGLISLNLHGRTNGILPFMRIDNEHIVIQINAGNAIAFKQLYDQSYVYLCAVAVKYIYDKEVAKDIVNDVFINIWNHRERLTYPVKAYLIASVRNRCLNHIRQKRNQEEVLDEIENQLIEVQEEVLNSEPFPLVELENKEMQRKIQNAIGTLPNKCRHIFSEYFYQNKTYEEIAEENNISPSTVRVQIKIAIGKLKTIMKDIYPSLLLILDFF